MLGLHPGGRVALGDDERHQVERGGVGAAAAPGMQSEHVAILRMCQGPTAVVEIAATLNLPVSIVRIMLCDLLDTGRISARHPRTARVADRLPDPDILEQVLVGLRNL
ncbi:DUF742 domain-containing protein [Streptomyces griseus]|uniref:DUF742 domain-containing protein n=1 Tax=Streptomyces griseus TaxID=1911 RepID=UPI003F73B7A1